MGESKIKFTNHVASDLIDELLTFMKSEMDKLVELPITKDIYKIYPPTIRMAIIQDCDYCNDILNRMKECNMPAEEISDRILKTVSGVRLSERRPAITDTLSGALKKCDDASKQLFVVRDIKVYVSVDQINFTVLNYYDKLDDVYEYWKLNIRHEIGHVIDNFHMYGRTFNDVKSQIDKEMKIYEETEKKFEELKKKGFGSERDLNYTYLKMYFTENPAEKRANEYAGFTEEELERLYCECDLN